MYVLRDNLWRLRRRQHANPFDRPATEAGDPDVRRRIDALGRWFQNIDINGTPTKMHSQAGEPLDYPAADWENFAPYLPDLTGKSVLDIGCNAGYHSIEVKKRGPAEYSWWT